jgi:hypothetical protein
VGLGSKGDQTVKLQAQLSQILILLFDCRSYGFDPLKLGEDPASLKWYVDGKDRV